MMTGEYSRNKKFGDNIFKFTAEEIAIAKPPKRKSDSRII
jgi:hypothetical protein